MSNDPTFLAFFAGETSVRLKAGQPLFVRGDKAELMYVVRSGTVRLHVGETTLELVGPGGLFGEMAIIDRAPRSASATAAGDCELAQIDERRFVAMLREAPMFGLNLLRLVTGRLRAMDRLLEPRPD